MTRPFLPSLTAIRGLAALHVMLVHFTRAAALSKLDRLPEWFALPAGGAIWAMNAFFALSGFVLVYMCADRPMHAPAFWYDRFTRLYPVFAFSLLLFAPNFFFFHLGSDPTSWDVQHPILSGLLVLSLLQAWVPAADFAWNGVSWTLSVDAFFILLFPTLLRWMSGFSRTRLIATIWIGWLIALLPPAIYSMLMPDGPVLDPDGPHARLYWLKVVYHVPLIQLPECIMGMAAGLLFLRSGPAKAPRRLVFVSVAVIVVTALVRYRLSMQWWQSGFIPIAVVGLLYGLASRPQWLSWRPLVFLGEISYGFYLIHFGIVVPSVIVLSKWTHSPWPSLVVALVVSIAVGYAVKRWIEVPARRWLRARAPAPKAALPIKERQGL